MQNSLRKYIIVSVFVHTVFAFFMMWSPVFQSQPEKNYKVTMIQLSRGDGGNSLKANFKNSKGLPQSTLREQKKALKKLAKDKKGSDLLSRKSRTKKTAKHKLSQKRTSDKGGLNLNKRKSTGKKSRINNALARIDQQLKQRDVQLEAGQAKKGESGQSPYGGAVGTRLDPAFVMYVNTIKRKINNEWRLSKSEFDGSLKTQIIVMIDERGNILRSRFKRGSGNDSFDASAMRAVRRSAPFPTPPSRLKKEALNEGFIIVFDPNRVATRI